MDESVVLDVLGSARSMRWFTDDPVSDELLEKLIWAGTRASNPNNTQLWDFVVITDPEVKKRVKQVILASVGLDKPDAPAWPEPEDPVERRNAQGARNVLTKMDAIPALIFVCGRDAYPAGAPKIEMAYSAMFAAAQNIIVAARALGLGAAFTTFHNRAEPALRELLGIPADRIIGVTMPVGYPAKPHGPLTRRPVNDVLHRNGW